MMGFSQQRVMRFRPCIDLHDGVVKQVVHVAAEALPSVRVLVLGYEAPDTGRCATASLRACASSPYREGRVFVAGGPPRAARMACACTCEPCPPQVICRMGSDSTMCAVRASALRSVRAQELLLPVAPLLTGVCAARRLSALH